MFEQLDIFKMSSAMAVHAGQKQAVISQNVANADTPGYAARDIPDFQALYRPAGDSGTQRASRARHLNGSQGGMADTAPFAVKDEASPNGNSVSLETEILKSTDAKRQHDRALAIYRSGLNILRTTIGK
jgi:flagellar basal-body rod protein FlgB